MKTKPAKLAKPKSTPRKAKTTANVCILRLYIAGQSPKSIAAVSNLTRICEENLAGQYRIQVIDLLENPHLARGDQILAIPTLVRSLPGPIRRVIGDLSKTDRVLVGLDLQKK